MPGTLRVYAVEGRLVPALDADGHALGRRFVARETAYPYAAIAAGAEVADDTHHRRAIARGDLSATVPQPPRAARPATGGDA